MKRIVVTGGTSALAQYLVPRLSEEYSVLSIGRKNCDLCFDLLENLDSFEIPKGTDVVVHTAASFGGSTDEEIIETEAVNALGTLKLCIAAHKAKVKHLVVVSSICATFNKDSAYYNIYSISKKHSEELAAYFCNDKKLPLTILRPSQIYDANGSFRKHQPLLYMMVDNAEAGKDISIFGTNDAMRNYIHVEDVCEIIYRVIKKHCLGIYPCLNPENIKLSDMARAAFSAFQK